MSSSELEVRGFESLFFRGTLLFLLLLLSETILFSQSLINPSYLNQKSEEKYPLFKRSEVLVNNIQFFNLPIDSLIKAFDMDCTAYYNGVRTCSNNFLNFTDNNISVISFTLSSKDCSMNDPNISVGMKLSDLKVNYPDLFVNVRTDVYNDKLMKVVSFYDINENEIRLYLNKKSLVLIKYFESEEMNTEFNSAAPISRL